MPQKLTDSVFHVKTAPCGEIGTSEIFKVTEQPASLHYDSCYQTIQQKQSAGPGAYNLNNFHSCNCEAPEVKKSALERPGYSAKQYRDGYGWTSTKGCNVDNDSKLRNSRNLTNLSVINQLYQRPYLSVPFMGRGAGNIVVESRMGPGEDTYQQRPCNTLAGYDMSNHHFTPMVKCLGDNIQNVNNIVAENNGWVNGGVPSRQMIRNKDYLEKCGYQYNGKMWTKSK
jgi:hypothetical protein